MFSRVVLRRIDPAASGRPDDIEHQPLSPRAEAPEMSERAPGRRSRLRSRAAASRFRFSSSTEATSTAGSEGPLGPEAARALRGNTHPALRAASSHYPDDDESLFDQEARTETTMPSRYSVAVHLPSTRLHLPGLQRTWSHGSNGPLSPRQTPSARRPPSPPSPACRPHTPPAARAPPPGLTQPGRAHTTTTRRGRDEADDLYAGGDRQPAGAFSDPAEAQLAHMAEDGRRRRERGSGTGRSGRRRRHHPLGLGGDRQDRGDETPEQREARRRRRREQRQRIRDIEDADDEGGARPHPKHFLFCFPWVKSRRVRTQILQLFVSGSFLLLLLSVYLALVATSNIANTEFSVLVILVILFAVLFFCQGLIRLCFIIFRPKPTEEELRRRERLRRPYGPSGYAVPRQPIQVLLARDEEAAGIESEATKVSPPAYGLWRESVRVDPNRIYWQRNTAAPPPPVPSIPASHLSGPASETGRSVGVVSSDASSPSDEDPLMRRPPSYASDDGVTYILEAQPRSTLSSPPGPAVVAMPSPMAMHPSERGRVGAPPRG